MWNGPPIDPRDSWMFTSSIFQFHPLCYPQRVILKHNPPYKFTELCKIILGTATPRIMDLPDSIKLAMLDQDPLELANPVHINTTKNRAFQRYFPKSLYKGMLIMAQINSQEEIQSWDVGLSAYDADLCTDGHLFFYRKEDIVDSNLIKKMLELPI